MSRYSAHSTDPEVIERVIDKLEGLFQELRERPPEERTRALPAQYIANHLACAPCTVKRWVAYHNERRRTSDISDRFCDIYARIASALSEVVSSVTFKIATNADNPRALSAALYLLPRMYPELFGESSAYDDVQVSEISDTPSEVFDDMSEAERERLKKIAAQHEALDREADELVESVAKRVADNSDP